jgi:anti-anti-sigma regulatory factor
MAAGWSIDSDNVRDWLWLRVAALSPDNGGAGSNGAREIELADSLMAIAAQRANHRLILELTDGVFLSSLLAGQLVVLHKRVHLKGGMLRLCGLSQFNRDVLRLMGVLDRFQIYSDRSTAATA